MGGLGRAVIRPHQTTNHVSHQEAIHPTDQGGKADLTRPNQRDFRSVTTTKGIVTFVGPGYNADGKACVHTSWWQTGPICSQLASDKGPMGIRVNSRLPATLESLASTQHGATHAVKRGPVTSLKGRGEKFNRKRSCGACQQESNTANQPPFVVPKSGGGWRPIIDLRRLNQYLRPPHFKMEGLHMLPNVVRQNFFMAKVDLKDAYLTVPVSAEFHCLLGFQDDNGQLLQFQTLPFGLCTAPYAFFKDNKASSSILTSSRHPYYHLPGRHVVSVTNGELTSAGSVDSSMAFLLPRASNKHTKDYSSPLLRDRVFGIHGEYQNQDCGPAYNQEEGNPVRGGQSPSEQNNLFEGALPASGQVSSHEASSVQGTITLSGTSTFENFHDESWTRGGYNSTGSRERLDLVAHTTANASLLPYCPEESISSQSPMLH